MMDLDKVRKVVRGACGLHLDADDTADEVVRVLSAGPTQDELVGRQVAQQMIARIDAAAPAEGAVKVKAGSSFMSRLAARHRARDEAMAEGVALRLLDAESDDKTLTVWGVAAKSFAQRIRSTLTAAPAPAGDSGAVAPWPAGNGGGWQIDTTFLSQVTREIGGWSNGTCLETIEAVLMSPSVRAALAHPPAAEARIAELTRERDALVDLHRSDRQKWDATRRRAEAAEAKLEAAAAALEPFKNIADEYTDAEDDDFQVWKDFDVLGATLPLRIFRRAREASALLSEPSGCAPKEGDGHGD